MRISSLSVLMGRLTLSEYKVGEGTYMDYSMFLMTPEQARAGNRMPTANEGDIVKTKYGPQLTCRITAKRLHGYSVEILAIDDTKEGHYSSWPEYKAIVEDESLTDEQKTDKIIEEIL